MKKPDLIAALSEAGITKAQAASVLDHLPQIAKSQFAKGEAFQIAGLVKITAQQKAARQGRNPRTGETVEIAAKVAVRAKAMIKL